MFDIHTVGPEYDLVCGEILAQVDGREKEAFDPFPRGNTVRLVAEVEGYPYGFIDFVLAIGYIKHLFVRPIAQNQGVGSALLAAAEQQMFSQANVKTLADNHQARIFYARRGYTEDRREMEENWKGQGPVEWIWMVKARRKKIYR